MNADRLKKIIQSLGSEVINTFESASSEYMQTFRGVIVRKYYSGRPGLNRINARLVNGWYVETKNKNTTGSTTHLSNDTKYAHVHEHANGFDGTIRFKRRKGSVFIPKRTDVLGDWDKYGQKQCYEYIQKKIESKIKQIGGIE